MPPLLPTRQPDPPPMFPPHDLCLRILRLAVFFLAMFAGSALAGDIEQDFADPPVKTRPYVWWHWMGSNVSKEGITKDLEAMKASGIGGATIFNLTSAVESGAAPTAKCPWPDITYRSPKWWEMVRFAAAEAQRLGLEIGMHNCVGYSATGGPWVTPEKSMQKLVWSETPATGPAPFAGTLPAPKATLGFYRDVAVVAAQEGVGIQPQDVVELTAKMDAQGNLAWAVPPGTWKIYRFGHTSTGAGPHPIPEDVVNALEVDKMDAPASRFHFEQVINPLKEHLAPYFGTTFTHLTLDSYEAGLQNWSPSFREEFKRRKGYDIVPWLVAMTPSVLNSSKSTMPRIVGDVDRTARFEWDYKDVIAQLFEECNFETGARVMHDAGLQMQFEAYSGPFSTTSGSALADLPMGEFWKGSGGGISPTIAPAARAAGRRVVGAEALTGQPGLCQYVEAPDNLKATVDQAFANGVNRLVLHHWVHQPFGDAFKPGMGMGWWGTHFGRNQTWYEPGKAFFAYLGRCQALLQRGESVSDFLALDTAPPGADTIDRQTLLGAATVDAGQVVLPSGRRYAFLYVAKGETMLPEVARKLRELVGAGATLVCARPERSPSLQNWPDADAELHRIANEVWGPPAPGGSTPRPYGKGRVQTDGSISAACQTLGIVPDFEPYKGEGSDVRWTHRRDGATDIYYLANVRPEPRTFTAKVRVSGMEPEIWSPEQGTRAPAGNWRERGGITEVDLHLDANDTQFIVLRRPGANADPVTSMTRDRAIDFTARVVFSQDGVERLIPDGPGDYVIRRSSGEEQRTTVHAAPTPMEIGGEWNLAFPYKEDAAGLHDLIVPFPRLMSWSLHEDPTVKYFSGTATYRKQVTVPADFISPDRRCFLDLGKVMNLAAIKINGRKLAVLWHPPYRMDITDALKPGVNALEIAVTNTWHNRLIGDEQEPADVTWGKEASMGNKIVGQPLAEYPDWFRAGLPRPSAGRMCFVTWNYFKKDDPLLDAGLLGPVTLDSEESPRLPRPPAL